MLLGGASIGMGHPSVIERTRSPVATGGRTAAGIETRENIAIDWNSFQFGDALAGSYLFHL